VRREERGKRKEERGKRNVKIWLPGDMLWREGRKGRARCGGEGAGE
jgi:hypothetical protein